MSTAVTINGVTYQQPDQGTPAPWGDLQASIIAALASTTLQKSGGAFTLTAETDFGATYGLKAAYFKSRTANIAAAGAVRLANTDSVSWRNNANGADLALSSNSSDHLIFATKDLTPMTTNGDLIYQSSGTPARLAIGTVGQVLSVVGGAPTWSSAPGSGDVVGPASATDGFVALWDGTSGKLLKNSTLNPSNIVIGPASATDNALARFDSTTGKLLQNSAAILDDSGNLSGINTLHVNADATLDGALTVDNEIKGNYLTASRALVTDGSKQLQSATTTATEIGYVNGVTSAIQTQIDTKVTSPVWATFAPTVTLVGGAGNTVPVYTTNTGRYLQVGKIIFVEIFLNGDGGAEGAGTGVITIALPAASGASSNAGFKLLGRGNNSSTRFLLTGTIAAGASVASLAYFDTISTSASFTGADQNNAARTVSLSFFYEAA